MDTKEVFQKLEENILDFLEKKYGFPQKAKVKNKSISYGSHSRDDYYIWKDQRMELKVNVHSYVPDPILKDILKIQGDFIFVLEYTSQEEIKKIEEEERKKDEESKKNLEERQKKEAERVEKLNERLRNSDSKPDL
jgi:hypothetical protein